MFPTTKVVMRPPEVFVRELSVEEGQRLRSVSRRARYQFKDQRVMTPHGVSDGHGGSRDRRARRLCRVARGQGDPCLQRGGARLARPHYRGGRPKKTTPAERDWIVAVARAPPPVPGGAGRFRRSVDRLRSSVGVELSPGGLGPDVARGRLSPASALVERESRSPLQGASGTRRVALERASRRWTGRLLSPRWDRFS